MVYQLQHARLLSGVSEAHAVLLLHCMGALGFTSEFGANL